MRRSNRYFTDEPMQSGLYSTDQMEQYGKTLATTHILARHKLQDVLLHRLDDNAAKLLEVRSQLAQTLKTNNPITPAGEWLLDNFYLIEEQIRLARLHFPKGYSEGIPLLDEEAFAGVPRVYDIALEIISHSDGRLDIEIVNRLLDSYQQIAVLKLGELWAIPIMLRLAIIENLRRIASRIAVERNQRDLADYWAKEMVRTAESERQKIILVIADMARSNPPLERAFVAELIRQLRGRNATLIQALNWIEDRLNETGHTLSEMVQADNQKQASDQLTISNCINSLRALNNIDWRDFVEYNSAVEKILRKDTIYPQLDFATRDQYRHVIEHIGKHSKFTETEVAELVLAQAQNSTAHTTAHYSKHVGYYLIDEGLKQTEKLTRVKYVIAERIRKFLLRKPLTIYLLPVIVITALLTFGVIAEVKHISNSTALIVIIAIIAAISSSQLAVSLINFIYTLWVKPVLLPKMNYGEGIPEEAKTLVIVPSMLISMGEVESLVEALEVRYLANKNSNLYFGLLTDYKDAARETLEEDDELLASAIERIKELNKKYVHNGGDVFFLFHRPRLFNPSEKVWMGYERKRGKLAALNQFLLNKNSAPFSVITGNTAQLQAIKYVLTLDSDTQLPRDSAAKIIAAIAHPLNHAVYDEQKQRVVRGYGILQPRVSVSMPHTESSGYAKLNGNEPGIDPYTRATSDVYQDLFKEGSFIGKGIYDVAVFEKVLHGRFPDNRILSHDLLEGCYTRAGLISDVQLYEKYPTRYSADMKRRHRWIRGDWQIAAWFLPWVPNAAHKWHSNPLSPLSRWKIFDNIRRSLFPAAVTLLILLGWLLLPLAGWWTLIVSGIIIIPSIVSSLWNLLHKPKDTVLSHHLILATRAAGNSAVSTLFTLLCLPYEAVLNLDAIVRTGWRMLVSKSHLLEWNPSNLTDKLGSNTFFYYYFTMAFEPLAGIGAAIYLYFFVPQALVVAGPVLLLWLVAPAVTWAVSQPGKVKAAELNLEQQIFLQKSARKIWSFFDDLMNDHDNWLPPDNIQEDPANVIAHRTSPTNIGLALLSNLSAYDLGFITASDVLFRCSNTFATLKRLERYHGHFYNWYDTQSLQPLNPRYVSTVDSGNLSGHLLTLKQGVAGLNNEPVIGPQFFEGLRTCLRLLADAAGRNQFSTIKSFKTELETVLQNYPQDLPGMYGMLRNLKKEYNEILGGLRATENTSTHYWHTALQKQIESGINELLFVAPWVEADGGLFKFEALISSYGIPDTYQLHDLHEKMLEEIRISANWNDSLASMVQQGVQNLAMRHKLVSELEKQCDDFADVEWDFLYNKTKQLLSIGYNVNEHRADNSYYDLLASEARLGVFVAIAQGKIPQESWFALGRHLLNVDGNPVLLSWSGSMFEYLMPLLVMPAYDNTLLSQTDRASVERQINYGKQAGIPWGVSESGYNMIDAAQNYQYHAFGVPGLGLKRGLGEDLVIAPYASMLALMVMPEKATQNLQQMAALGFEGRYGLYEAVDYTASRLSRNQSFAVIRSFMAHHQGMGFLSIASVLVGQRMQHRFESEPIFNSALLLLEERIPKTTSFYIHTNDVADTHAVTTENEIRIIHTPDTAVPEVQLLGNNNYQVMLTAAGSGYSRWKGLALTRWREDTTCDNWGSFCYIRDLESGSYWSTTYQPTLRKGKQFEVAFSQGRADYRDVQESFEMHTEIVVSPEDDIEMRRVHITNRTGKRKIIDITTFAEVVLAAPAADNAHPAFSKLFVETDILQASNAIICTRRPKTADERPPFMFHLVKLNGKQADEVSYETDRLKFNGRTNATRYPQAMQNKGALSGSKGPVLDPIVAIRYKLVIENDETVVLDTLMGAADTKEACMALVTKYQDKAQNDRVFDLAWTHGQVVLRQINATVAEAQLYTRLAASVIFLNPAMRAENAVLARNTKGQSALWPYSISGDLPIVFARIEEDSNADFIKQLVQAHNFWRLKGLPVDLVICNESHGGYRQELQAKILEMVSTHTYEKRGGIFVRSADQISNEDRILFQTVARINVVAIDSTLADFVNRKTNYEKTTPYLSAKTGYRPVPAEVNQNHALAFSNGFGGFNAQGNEYVITTSKQHTTPMPWVNVLANENFGTVISENGQSYTWSENSHEYRLTPWNNDPVSDTGGEAFYIRDEDTGFYWSPLTALSQKNSAYTVRHGFGYTVFEHTEDGIQTEMHVFVDTVDAIKFNILKIKNLSNRARNLTVTGYAEWVLGDLRERNAMYINTDLDLETGALLAHNSYNTDFPERVAFFDTDETEKALTVNRTEFIGRNKTLQYPESLLREKLSGRKNIGSDPCAAMQVKVQIGAGKDYDVVFKMGAGKNKYLAKELIKKFKGKEKAFKALETAKAYWRGVTNTVQVTTPDAALNVLANGWLVYQTLACRIWARTGFYQSGGAYGFRDQLQDSMAVMHVNQQVTRQQILLSAAKQFVDGDALHWWHPPLGRGIRSKCSDDFLWLPYVTATYIAHTGDYGILKEEVYFVEGRQLDTNEESNYDLPLPSSFTSPLYQHCVNAIRHGMRYGQHGLPLIGTGDWNDGMDRVGNRGKGESVWLAFFFYDVMQQFIPIALANGDNEFVTLCKAECEKLKKNIDANAWDGEWYKRAYFDDGSPLGSSVNAECRIDSISQSWSLLSGAGDKQKSATALNSAYKALVDKDTGLIKLLYPPFDKSNLEPGYIKGYLPGVRENGGQYTHAAIWFIMAYLELGEHDKAFELFSLINPVNHALNEAAAMVYKGEPYVMAADVASQAHNGKAGWTWYTGSSGWTYRLVVEHILGLKVAAGKMYFEPKVPSSWNGFEMKYHFGNTTYFIKLIRAGNGDGAAILQNGQVLANVFVELHDTGGEEQITVIYTAAAEKIDVVV